MDVFISWSGETSHKVALILKEWLPLVIPTINPWVSSEDIEKGERWEIELAQQLDRCSVGIICVNSENINSPWLNFEAGALSKSVEKGKILPFVLDLAPSDIRGPLSQFQITVLDKDDIKKFVKKLNKFTPEPTEHERLENLVDSTWPTLWDKIVSIPPPLPHNFRWNNRKKPDLKANESRKDNSTEKFLNVDDVRRVLAATKLPSVSQDRLAESPWIDRATLKKAIAREIEYLKDLTGSGKVFGLADSRPVSTSTRETNKHPDNELSDEEVVIMLTLARYGDDPNNAKFMDTDRIVSTTELPKIKLLYYLDSLKERFFVEKGSNFLFEATWRISRIGTSYLIEHGLI